VVPLVTVPPDIARLDGDDVGVRIGDVDNDGTLDLLVITNDWLVQGETDPLVEALWSAAAWTTGVSFGRRCCAWVRVPGTAANPLDAWTFAWAAGEAVVTT